MTYSKYMSVSNLDFFYDNVSQEEFKKILSSVNYENNNLFFTLYNNAPEFLKPSLEEESNFVSLLCSRVKSLPEEEFNHWFFDKNLKEFSNLHDIKKLIEKTEQHNEDFFCLINPVYANLNESLKEKFVSKKIKI